MTDEEKIKVEKVIRDIAMYVPGFPEERMQNAIQSITSLKSAKDAIEKIAMRMKDIFSGTPQFKEIYIRALEQLLTIDKTAFESIDELLAKVEFNENNNILPGNMSIEENHAILNDTLRSVCTKLNELGVDYYLVGAMSAFIGSGVPLFRYHDDLDFMIAEKDIDKVREALKDSDFVFEDNRLSSKKTYTPGIGVHGEH